MGGWRQKKIIIDACCTLLGFSLYTVNMSNVANQRSALIRDRTLVYPHLDLAC